MMQSMHTLEVRTSGKSLVPITREVVAWVQSRSIATGLLTLWCRHTSASLTVQENADPAVQRDILAYFERLAPEGAAYVHNDEGTDDMPAHLRAMLTNVQLSIPVSRGLPVLGTWQGIYLFEHRRAPHRREIAMHLFGE